MDSILFLRTTIAIMLGLFCGGLIFTIIIILIGNTYYILKYAFEKSKIKDKTDKIYNKIPLNS